MLDEAADVACGDVGLQRPRGVGVADDPGQVRNVLQQRALVGHELAEAARLAVDTHLDAAEDLELQAGGGDDDIGLQLLAGFEPDATLGESVDLVGDDRGLAGADGLEQVAVRHRAEALVPGFVARREVTHVGVLAELLFHTREQQGAHALGPALRSLVDPALDRDVASARELVDPPLRQDFAEPRGDLVVAGHGEDVARRALQHGHVRGCVHQRRHQRHRSRAAADHDDTLGLVVEVFRPVLRVDAKTLVALHAGEVRQVAVVVVVVAGAADQQLARERALSAAGFLGGGDGPLVLLAGELGARDLQSELDLPVDAVFARGVGDVLADRGAVGQHLERVPRPECVAEAEHVRIRADAGIAEQVPGPADGRPSLEDRHALARTFAGQVAGHADARQAGTDDQHVVMILHCLLPSLRGPCPGRGQSAAGRRNRCGKAISAAPQVPSSCISCAEA